MMAILIPPHELPKVWEFVRPWISAACGYNGNRYNAEDSMQEIRAGTKQLWIAEIDQSIVGVVITALMNFPQKKCCTIDICTGEKFSEWGDLVNEIEKWAILNECNQMFLIARPGMEKLLKEHNYIKTHTVFEKELKG